ncbi:MAG TPA: epoxide hydrolase [Acidimicrobiales bacterium]
MIEIEPFRIDVPDAVLDDLRARIRATRWPEPAPGEPWAQGTDLAYLRELCEHWADEFDWRRVEAQLNRLPQFVTSIEGQRLHFVHVRSPHEGALPLVLSHGWPGTFAEFVDVIGPLTDPTAHGGDAADAFHVVCPSLPGFVFSGPTREPGWTPHRMAGALVELMDALGYEHFGAQGGDWGAMVSSQLGQVAPHRVVGIHLNLVIAPPPRDGDPMAGLSEREREQVESMRARGRDEMGYQQIQSTRPQTLSVGLNDSPVGLAAWIVEKYRAWGDCVRPDGVRDVERRFSKDTLLTCVTLYWITSTIASANRLYAEARRAGVGASRPEGRVPVPMGYARFPADGFTPPRAWVERQYDVVHWSELPEGGHFPALEVPQLLVDDIRTFFRPLRETAVGA